MHAVRAAEGMEESLSQRVGVSRKRHVFKGFKHLSSDAGIFICQHSNSTFAIIVAYVLFVGPNQSFIKSKKQLFMTKWECRDLGDCKEFLHMHVQCKG